MTHHLRRLKSTARPITALLIACLLMVTAAAQPAHAGSDTFTTAGNGNWIAPAGVTSITVECWGGGGGGGADTNSNNGAGGGGGGGAYALATYTVIPGNTYTYTVGAGGSGGTTGGGAATAGGTSSFHGGSCVAVGGGAGANAGNNSNGNGGLAGAAASSTGTTKYSGGAGAAGQTSSGGGGGSSAGTAANGNTATTSSGATAVTGGGPGGTGNTSNNGSAPASGPGGGGGGGEYAGGPGGGPRSGGAGFAGKIVITYKTTPSLSITNSPVTYNGSAQAASLSAKAGATNVPGTFSNILYNGVATVPTNAGSYAVTANFTPTDGANYNSLTNASAGTFVIDKVTPTLSVNGPFTYDGTQHPAFVTGSVPGTATNVLYDGSPTAPINAGTYAVTANFTPGDTTNYATLTNASAGNFVINKATTTTTVTCSGGPFTYTGLPFTPCSATVTGTGLNQVLTVVYSNNVNAGTATASASYVATTNYAASSDSKIFTIDKAATTTVLICAPEPFIYTGSAIEPCAAAVTGAGGLNQAVTVLYGNNINAGTASASANFAATINYLASSDAKTFIISKANLTLSVGNSPAVYNGSQQVASIVATGPAGTVAGTASGITYDSSAVAPTNAGTYAVVADFAPGDTANYNNVTTGSAGSFVIQPAATTTTVTCAAGPFVFNGTVFEPCSAVATGPAGLNQALTVVYADNINAGTASASASFDGTPNYQSSSDNKTFLIEKATPTLSITGASPTYDATQHAATVVGSVGGTVSNILYNGSAIEPTNAGTYAVTANFAPTDAANYNSLTDAPAGSFVINKATPTLSITNSPIDFDGTPKNANVVGSVPGTVANVTYNGSPTVPTGPGTFGVNADFTPTDAVNYNSLTNTSAGNFVIQQIGVPTLSVANSPQTFNGAPQAAQVLSSVAGTLSNVLYNGSATVPTDAGSYIITADFTPVDTVNYQTLVGATAGTLVIQKAATTTALVCSAGPFTYNGTAFTPCTASVTGPVGLSQALTVVYANNVNAGTASASASYAGTINYLASSGATNFTISKATATLLVTNSPVSYNGTPKTANVGSSIPGTVSNVRYNGSATAPTNAGTYAITADFVPSNTTNFATLSSASAGNFVIQKAGTPTLSVSNSPATYDGTPKAATVVGSVAGTVSNVKYNGSATVPTGAGTYIITADFVPNDGNMNSVVAASAGSFTIAKAATATTLDCGVGTFPYSGSQLTPCTATVTGAGGLNQSVTVTYVGNVDVGTAAVNAKYAGSANYLASSAVDTFVIDKAATTTVVTCAPGPFTVTGSAIEPCTAVVTGPGGLSQSLTVIYSNNVAVGTATATANYGGGASYLPSNDTEVFIIGAAVDTTVFLNLPFLSK